MVVLPPDEVSRAVMRAIQDDIAAALASPEFDEVSVDLVLSTPGEQTSTSPSLETVLFKGLSGTEAATISLVWCGYLDVEDEALERDLVALRAVRARSPIVQALRQGIASSGVEVIVRDMVIEALDAVDGIEAIPRATIEAAISGFPVDTGPYLTGADGQLPSGAPNGVAYAASPAQRVESPVVVPPMGILRTQDDGRIQGAGGDGRSPAVEDPEFWHSYNETLGNHGDAEQIKGPHVADATDIASALAISEQDKIGADYAADGESPLRGIRARLRSAQPEARRSERLSPFERSAVSSRLEEWRARRTKVRRAEDQIGISALEQLPVTPGVKRPLIYFVLAASNDWNKGAVRTRDAAITLLSNALDQQWIAVAINLGSSLTIEAGPASAERVARDWKRVDRSNEFDLGTAASDLEVQLSRDLISLRLRGHEIDTPHIVIFATEPPYVDSAAHSAYLALAAEVQSVTWMLVGDTADWMEVPPELEEAPSRVLYAEQDGVVTVLTEVLIPSSEGTAEVGEE